jgi:hypothetical protein
MTFYGTLFNTMNGVATRETMTRGERRDKALKVKQFTATDTGTEKMECL